MMTSGTAGVRARANRVQNMLDHRPHGYPPQPLHQQQQHQQQQQQQQLQQQQQHNTAASPVTAKKNAMGLESSWWGNMSTTSQVLTSSVVSLSSRVGADGGGHHYQHHHHHPGGGAGAGAQAQQANTKQLMRLMDSLKTLGDENATLLREVEEAEAARQEAKNARAEMKRFKAEYSKRFAHLKAALEKFRQEHPQGKGSDGSDPVNTSEFMRSASVAEQLARQEQLIRKLTADLKKEKEESKKKDAALRKYESFYREVKARSAQKAALKTQQQRQHKAPRQTSIRTPSR